MGKFLKTFGLYFIGNTGSRIISFLINSIITAYVSTDEYGYYASVDSVMNIVVTLVFLQMWSGILRYLFEYDNKRMKNKVITAAYSIQFISLIIFTLGFVIFNIIHPLNHAFFIYLLYVSYAFHQNVSYTVRGLGYNRLYVISGLLGSVINLVFHLILLLGFGWEADALILSFALSYLIPAVFMEFFAKTLKRTKPRYLDKQVLGTIMRYSFPLSLNQGAYWINNKASTMIIQLKLGLSATGIFAASNKFTSLISLVVMVFNLAWQEYTFSMAHDENRIKKYNLVLKDFVSFVSCGVLILIPLTKFVFSFFIGDSYQTGIVVIPLAYLGTFLDALTNFIGAIMSTELKIKSQLVSMVVGAAVTIIFMFATIGFLNIQAATVASIACYLIVIVIRVISLRKTVALKFSYKYFFHYGIMFAITSYVFFKFSSTVNLLFAVVVAVYCIIVLKDLIRSFINMILKKAKTN